MSTPLKPFLIGDGQFKNGINTYLQSWRRPEDAFDPLVNAFVYRGALQKRNGSTIFGDQLDDMNPVMGIMQFQNESTAAVKLVVATTANAYLYVAGMEQDAGTFSLLTGIGGSDSIFWQGNVTSGTTSIASTSTFWVNLVPSSITITAYDGSSSVGVVSDDGSGNFSGGSGIFSGASGTVDYTTGAVAFSSITIASSYVLSLSITATTTGDYFSGNIKNFFNWTNWQPTESGTVESVSYLHMVNNADPLTIFDGTNLARPVLYVDSTLDASIATALDVKVYGNRLLLIRPTITGETNAANQAIYFSSLFSPFNFITDVAGNGGYEVAATGDILQTASFLRDNLIVAFSRSHWSFQNTGMTAKPFIFRKLNVSKSVACPYGGTDYDERITNLGNTGFVACDGVNVQRFDIPVVDYYETKIDQQYFNQVFSIRYDNLNQTWLFYVSTDANPDQFPVVGGVAPGSDQVLIYNFFENNWATYQNSFPMTCMGLFNATFGTRWEDLEQSWESTQRPWFAYSTQATSPILLGGDTSGNVYHLDNGDSVRDGEKNIYEEQITTGNGGTTYSGTLDFHPVLPGSLTATDGVETFTDNGKGVLMGDLGGSGTIVYATGAWTLIFNTAVIDTVPIYASYVMQGESFNVDIMTNRWNPFVGSGQKTQFAYIDIYYSVSSTDPMNPIQVTLDFYVDNNSITSATRVLVLDDPKGADFAWKRIFCNLIGEFIEIEIDPSEDAPFQILGMILWARPAGRLTPF